MRKKSRCFWLCVFVCFLNSEGGQALAQVVQGGGGFSIPGDAQNPSGCGPQQCPVADPA